MKAQIWIDGRPVPFRTAHLLLVGSEQERVQINVPAESSESIRVSVVARGDVETETPITYERWKRIAKDG